MAEFLVFSIRDFQSRQMVSARLDLLYDLQIAMRISWVPFVPLSMSSSEAGYASTLTLNTGNTSSLLLGGQREQVFTISIVHSAGVLTNRLNSAGLYGERRDRIPGGFRSRGSRHFCLIALHRFHGRVGQVTAGRERE
jgi:hypothetical protein